MFAKLKEKWNVNWFQFVLIFTTFALGGSLCAKAGNWLLSYFLAESDVLYWIILYTSDKFTLAHVCIACQYSVWSVQIFCQLSQKNRR